jgi:3-oxoacyl-[acyl-carrier protein] reductase
MPLTDKIALVTGSSRGIGRAIAVALAKAGAHVAINYRERSEEARDVEREIRGAGRDCLMIQADVSRADEVTRLVNETQDRFGTVDILVNNAGIGRPQAFEELTERDWDAVFAVNVKSCFLLTQAVLPRMREHGWGRIINLSSVAAQVGGIIGPHYASSKAALLGLTHFYASRMAAEGITVNAIAPALIDTEMVTSNPNARPDRIPVRRFGSVSEVADVAVMLAMNGYITGQTINVNGGWYMS